MISLKNGMLEKHIYTFPDFSQFEHAVGNFITPFLASSSASWSRCPWSSMDLEKSTKPAWASVPSSRGVAWAAAFARSASCSTFVVAFALVVASPNEPSF